MKTKTITRKMNGRRGVTLLEMVVAAIVMAAVMSLVTSLCFRISLVWKDIGHRRVAVAELSNQLERLTRMSPQEALEALESLQPSELSQRTLAAPQLRGDIFQSEIGHRIELQLNWTRRHPGQPIELTGWIPLRPNTEEPAP